MNLRRRDFNRAALWLALIGWAGAPATRVRAGPAASRWKTNPFALGVASGQPRSDSVVLWTRLMPQFADESAASADAGYPVRYEIYGDAALRRPLQQGEAMAWPSRAHSVHVPLRGLAPQRDYWYRFTCGDAVSAVGHTRTAPAPESAVTRLRLALAACQHYEQGFYVAHREIARRELDFVLFVGDYIYEGSSPEFTVRKHATPTPHTLEGYRARHALYKTDPDLQAAHAAHPWILTWDDHEVVNDYADDRGPNEWDAARFLRRRAAAYRAYFEHMPLAVPPQGASMRIHDQFRWGRLAELWTLDCRQHRSHHACAEAEPAPDHGRIVTGCAELADPARSMLGAEQERWLAPGLAASGARWNLLAQSTQMNRATLVTPEGRATWTDGWDGYPLARQRLLQGAADASVANLVVLGGDVHRHLAGNLRLRPGDDASPVMASEFVGGSVTSRGAGQGALDRMRGDNPDILHARGDQRGYALLDLTPEVLHCEFRATPHPALAAASLDRQAAFVVEAGRAGVQPA